jgi:hypothetical protein
VPKASVTPRRRKSLSLAQQAFALQHVFPAGVIGIKPTRLEWTGVLTPTPLSCDYTVRITYSVGRFPRVVIVDPPLVPDEHGLLPHFYREGSLCLHEAHEWDGSMLIADSIIPWTTEWLAHYELWKWSGQWYGDGEPAAASLASAVPAPPDDDAGQPRGQSDGRAAH